MNKNISIPRDPISAYTHLIGIILSLIGTVFIVFKGLNSNLILNPITISSIGFGFSLIALYSASTIYHWSNASNNAVKALRKLDHSMIYVLIAGTYTPILINYLPKEKGIIFGICMWGAAILGIIMKLCWINAPRILGTALYIVMGWAILFDVSALKAMSAPALTLLLAGGISYTLGAVIYAIKKPNISKSFGFHELFHIFVMLGSLFHYFIIYLYIL